MKNAFLVLLLLISSITVFCQKKKPAATKQGAAKVEVLTNTSVTNMAEVGLDESLIISKIENSKCNFDISTEGMIALKKAGVSSNIIKSMVNRGTGNAPTAAGQTKAENSSPAATPAGKKNGTPDISMMNHVYVFEKNNSTARPLEKLVAGVRTKQGFLSGASMLQVEGAKSTIQLTQAESSSFIINTGSGNLPELILYRVKSTKGKREVASMKASTFKGVSTGEDVITINITKLQEGIYQIAPGTSLPAGEYFFTTKPVAGANSVDAFAFGVGS